MIDLSKVDYEDLKAELKRRNAEAWSLMEVPAYVLLTAVFFAGYFVRLAIEFWF